MQNQINPLYRAKLSFNNRFLAKSEKFICFHFDKFSCITRQIHRSVPSSFHAKPYKSFISCKTRKIKNS